MFRSGVLLLLRCFPAEGLSDEARHFSCSSEYFLCDVRSGCRLVRHVRTMSKRFVLSSGYHHHRIDGHKSYRIGVNDGATWGDEPTVCGKAQFEIGLTLFLLLFQADEVAVNDLNSTNMFCKRSADCVTVRFWVIKILMRGHKIRIDHKKFGDPAPVMELILFRESRCQGCIKDHSESSVCFFVWVNG